MARWMKIRRGERIPDDAVIAGTTDADGSVWVGRFNGEAGKINATEDSAGESIMFNFWGHNCRAKKEADILVCKENRRRWIDMKRGDRIPLHVVEAGQTSTDGVNFVAKFSGHAGKINVDKENNMWNFWSHGPGCKQAAQIFAVDKEDKIRQIRELSCCAPGPVQSPEHVEAIVIFGSMREEVPKRLRDLLVSFPHLVTLPVLITGKEAEVRQIEAALDGIPHGDVHTDVEAKTTDDNACWVIAKLFDLGITCSIVYINFPVLARAGVDALVHYGKDRSHIIPVFPVEEIDVDNDINDHWVDLKLNDAATGNWTGKPSTIMLTYCGPGETMGELGSFDTPKQWFRKEVLKTSTLALWKEKIVDAKRMKAAVVEQFPVPKWKQHSEGGYASWTGRSEQDEIACLDIGSAIALTDPSDTDKVQHKVRRITELMEPNPDYSAFEVNGEKYYLCGPFASRKQLLKFLQSDPMLQPVHKKWSSFQKCALDQAFQFGSLYLQIKWQGWYVRPVLGMSYDQFDKFFELAQDTQ